LKLRDLIKETKMLSYSNDGDKQNFFFFWKMSNGDGKFKSDKQANFFYNQYKKHAWDQLDTYSSKINPPPDTEMVVYLEMEITGMGGVQWRSKTRRKGRILYMNRNGIIRYDEVKFEYDDKLGWSGVKEIVHGKTFNTPKYDEQPAAPKAASVWDNIKTYSSFVSSVGKRELMNLTVYKINSFQSRYGTTHLYIMYDDKFNMFVYKGTLIDPKGEYVSEKNKYDIEFKIKKHDVFNNIKQNVIERPKVL